MRLYVMSALFDISILPPFLLKAADHLPHDPKIVIKTSSKTSNFITIFDPQKKPSK